MTTELDVCMSEWIRQQNEIRAAAITVSDTGVDLLSATHVAGFDISFDKTDPDRACAALVVCDAVSLAVVYEDYEVVQLTMPYIPCFLGFREVPHYLLLLERLRARIVSGEVSAAIMPQIALVDGFGLLHPRAGSASQLGVAGNIPTIGVGKTLMAYDGLDEHKVRGDLLLLHTGVTEMDLVGDSGKVHGVAVLASSEHKKPIYVSIGHRVDLVTAVALVKRLCRHRIPEPIRQADTAGVAFA